MPTSLDTGSASDRTGHRQVNYRPEIDGLRALAVLGVIIYHADFAWRGTKVLGGGFLGVDIFFVISGFLITSIILRELQNTDSFSFARFYERRARRILPALFTVMLASIPFAWMYMTPAALSEFAGSGLSSIFFGSNIWFWLENSYTAEVSQLKPFLHTWTLSVEEQFYVFFPILMIVIWRLFRRWQLLIMIGLGLASLQLAEFSSYRYADANFYLLPTRGWELLAGSILALIKPRQDAQNQFLAGFTRIAPITGLVMVVGSFVLFSDAMRHPSYVTAIPIVGTALLIFFASKNDWITNALSWKGFVGIGLISYSLYLWHFPVFVFARLSEIELTFSIKLLLIGLSILLATLTYFYIETPFRRKQVVAMKPFLAILGAAFLVLVSAFSGLFSGHLLPAKYAKALDLVDFNYDYQPVFREGTCFLTPNDMEPYALAPVFEGELNPFQRCEAPADASRKPVLFLWGDSHAAHLYSGLESVLGDQYAIVQRTASACSPILGQVSTYRPGCKEVNDFVLQEIQVLQPERVLLAAYWQPGSAEAMRDTLQTLRDIGISEIEIVGPVPRWQTAMPVLISEIATAGEAIPAYISQDLEPGLFAIDEAWKRFAANEGYRYQSPLSILCRNEACLTRVAPGPEGIVQWDTAHLTVAGSEYLVTRFNAD